jgi:hypothetical protein
MVLNSSTMDRFCHLKMDLSDRNSLTSGHPGPLNTRLFRIGRASIHIIVQSNSGSFASLRSTCPRHGKRAKTPLKDR